MDTFHLYMLKNSLSILTDYFISAERRIRNGEIPLNSAVVQDAQFLIDPIRAKIEQLEKSN